MFLDLFCNRTQTTRSSASFFILTKKIFKNGQMLSMFLIFIYVIENVWGLNKINFSGWQVTLDFLLQLLQSEHSTVMDQKQVIFPKADDIHGWPINWPKSVESMSMLDQYVPQN